MSDIYKNILDNLSEAVYVRDLDMNIIYINPAAEELSGWNFEGVKGKKCYNYFGDEHKACREICPAEKAISENRKIEHYEGRLLTKDGFVKDVRVAISPYYESGEVIGAVSVLYDITHVSDIEKSHIKDIIALQKEIKQRRFAEERYRNLIENINEVIFVIDNNGIIKYMSPVIEKISLYKPTEVEGQLFSRFVHPEDVDGLRKAIKQTYKDKTTTNDFRVLGKNGEIRYIRTSNRILYENGEIIGITGILTDITEQKKAKDALIISEERFKALSNASFEGIVIHKNGKIVDVNRAYADMFGYNTEDIIDKNVLDFVAPESRNISQKYISQDFENTFEVKGLKKDGTVFPIEVRGKTINYEDKKLRIATVRDISERKSIEKELNRTEKKFRTLVDSMDDVVFTIGPDYRCTGIYGRWLEKTGYNAEDIVGMPLDKFLKPEEIKFRKEVYDRAFNGETVRYEWALTLKGKKYDIQTVLSPVRNDEGKVDYIVGVSRDITEIKEMQEEHRISKERYIALIKHSSEAIWCFEMKTPVLIDDPEEEQILNFYENAYLTECNDVMARMHAYKDADEIKGISIKDLLVLSDPNNMDLIRNLIRSSYKIYDAESHEIDKNGNDRFFLNNIIGIIEKGKLIRIWGTQREIKKNNK